MARHGFYDGPEGHGSSFGVGGGVVAVFLGDGGEEAQVPDACGPVEGQGGVEAVGGVALGPALLVEGLDDGVLFAEGLAETEAEDDLTVGQVGGDLADAPFAGLGRSVDLGRREGCGEGAQTVDRCRQDRDRLEVPEELCVRI